MQIQLQTRTSIHLPEKDRGSGRSKVSRAWLDTATPVAPTLYEVFIMRHSIALTAALAGTLLATALTPAGAQAVGRTEDPDRPVEGGGTLPTGWSARPDKDGDVKNVKFVVMEPGYHLTLGPATILYREQDRVSGPFHT